MITIEANGVFSLGRQGENGYRQITFDLTDLCDDMDLTDAEVVCLLERPNSDPYICDAFSYDLTGKTAVLTVTETETAIVGRCRLELDLVISDVVGKTKIYACNVLPSLMGSQCTGEIPWVSRVIEASEQAQSSASSASASATQAENYATQAQGYAQSASQSAQTASSAKDTAVQSAEDAQGYAESAEQSAQTASAKVAEVTAEGTRQIGLVQSEGTTQVSAVQSAGSARVAEVESAIEAKGAETLASIPSDYTALGNDVSDLKTTIMHGGDIVDTATFVNGARTSTGEIYETQRRCTTSKVYVVSIGSTIEVKNVDSGLKFSVAGVKNNTFVYDSGWQTSDFTYNVAVDADAWFINVSKISDATLSPSELITFTATIEEQSYFETLDSEIGTLDSKIENLSANLYGENIGMPFELGLVTYNTTDWRYADGNTMIRTPADKLVRLHVGTRISLTSYEDAKFYVGWVDTSGNLKYKLGWNTTDYTVTEEGDYSLLVANATPRAQTSVDALASLVKITPIDVVESIYNSDKNKKRSLNPTLFNSLFIAHRGSDYVAPENTLPAFKWAYDSGYRIFEYDVRFTSDNVPVLIHDDTINRTARNEDGSTISDTIYVAQSTYQQLLQYDFGIWKGATYAGTKIPTLEEFLIFIKARNCCGDTDWTTLGDSITDAQIDIFMDTVIKCGMAESIMITSNTSVIGRLLAKYHEALTCIANVGTPLSTLDACANVMHNSRMPIVSLQYPYATKEMHDYAHRLGLYTKTFTPNSNTQINESLPFAPDLMIVGGLGRNEIVIE